MRCPLFDTCCFISTKRGAGTSGRRFGQTSFRIVENVETKRDPNKGFRGTLATRITGFRRAIFFLLSLFLSPSRFVVYYSRFREKRKRIRESYYIINIVAPLCYSVIVSFLKFFLIKKIRRNLIKFAGWKNRILFYYPASNYNCNISIDLFLIIAGQSFRLAGSSYNPLCKFSPIIAL